MPAGHNKTDKYFNNIKIDKENDVCFFNDEQHKYYNKETMQTYISCTTIISKYGQEFQAEFWASYKALEALLPSDIFKPIKVSLLSTKKFDSRILDKVEIDKSEFEVKKQEILNGYKKASEDACIKGTLAHEKKELSFYNRTDFDFGKYGYKDLKGKFDCKENYYKLDLKNGVYPEFLIQWESPNKELMIAGISDLVIVHDLDLYIIDWKTSKIIEKKGYYNKFSGKTEKMKFPLNNLDESNFNHYQLQLSLYSWMIQQQRPDLNVKGLMIIQLKDDGTEVQYPCEYLKSDVERMINHYIKHQKMQKELDKDKPIKI